MNTVLVTGGSGFIGSLLCERLLNKGNKVVSVDIESNQRLNSGLYEYYQYDVNDIDNLEMLFRKNTFDMVYHLASNTSIPQGQTNVNIDLSNTFNTTISVLMMLQKYNVKKFVFFSSSTVYGTNTGLCTEDTSHLFPISYYGASKLASEAFVSAYCHLYNIQTWVIRPCNVVGPKCHGIIRDIKEQLSSGCDKLCFLGDGAQEKPFIYIDDFLDGVECVVDNAKELYNVYLVGNDNTTSIKRVAEIAREINDSITGVEWRKESTWPGDVHHYNYDTRKLRQLGWSPRYSTDEAIKKALYD